MALEDALRGFADQLAVTAPGGPVQVGTVTAVTAGGGRDGLPLVSVATNSGTFDAAHLAAYASPAVGHLVLVLLTAGGGPIIAGQLVGLPPED